MIKKCCLEFTALKVCKEKKQNTCVLCVAKAEIFFFFLLFQVNSHLHHIFLVNIPFVCTQTHHNGSVDHNCEFILIFKLVNMLLITLKSPKKKNLPNYNCVFVNYLTKLIKLQKNRIINGYVFSKCLHFIETIKQLFNFFFFLCFLDF